MEIKPLTDEELSMIQDGADVTGSAPQWQVSKLAVEILRLKQMIRRRNHCVDCGKLNPIDNVCDDCLEEDRAA